MEKQAFYPEHVVEQIKAFFRGVRDISDFYYKLALLNGLCHACDGRGYLSAPDQPCPHCQASGSANVWHRAKVVAGKRASNAAGQ